MPCKVAVSSAPMATSRWRTSATVTSGTGGGGGAVFAVHPAPSAATAATRERGEQREAWSLLGEVTGDPPRRSPTFGNDTAEIGLGTYPSRHNRITRRGWPRRRRTPSRRNRC